MKRLSKYLVVLCIIAVLFCAVACDKNAAEDFKFEYWNDGEAFSSIKNYVKAVTDQSGQDYIPVKDRIAVFDMDGTLACETYYTYYDTMMFIEYCLVDHPEKVSEELKDVARAIKPGYTADETLARNFAKAYAGMTVKEFYDYAVSFGQKHTQSFNNMRYIDNFYLPMVELVRFLYENDFTVYVISGTERTTTRAIIANSPIKDYVTPNHVIGTDFEVKQRGHETESSNMNFKYEDGDDLVLTGGFIQKNLNANKSIYVEREIGQRPVLAFGNSGSDTSMMNYAIDSRNPYKAQAYMIVADDDVREWGNANWTTKSADYKAKGYVPVSMKNDFAKIYPDTITKAAEQYHENVIESKYADRENWACYSIDEEKDADVFYVVSTSYTGTEHNMPFDNEDSRYRFDGALNMEKGIYTENARMFAPYYSQAAMNVYSLVPEEREQYLSIAYADVSEAFDYYINYLNDGNPIILAGFSQGADMCYRLLEEYFEDSALYEKLIAVYAIGWACTEDMTINCSAIKPATGEDDVGVVITFDCEAPAVTETLINPAGTKTYSINPLNWKTDGTVADKSLNPGACFVKKSGEIKAEISELCGCYIDVERGVLKVTDINPSDYPPVVPGMPEGAYHVYDYQLFYRALQSNVATRIAAYQDK